MFVEKQGVGLGSARYGIRLAAFCSGRGQIPELKGKSCTQAGVAFLRRFISEQHSRDTVLENRTRGNGGSTGSSDSTASTECVSVARRKNAVLSHWSCVFGMSA